ncbi:MAG: lysophospholipid acyltransferase family protein [Cyanophyceae cyanobacterium]
MDDQHSTKKKETVTSRISPWLARLLYPLGCYVVLPLFFGRLEVTGQENIPRSGPVIVAPTHRSRWDALVVPYAVGRLVSGRDLHYMVSVNEMKGIQGWFIRRMGGFPVDPEHPGIRTLRHSVELLSEDKMLVIFPEGALRHGGVYRDEWIHPLQRGVATVALEAESRRPGCGAHILPVSIKYSEAYPRWGTEVKVDIGVSLRVADYGDKSSKKSSQRLTADLEAALKKLYEPSDRSQPVSAA